MRDEHGNDKARQERPCCGTVVCQRARLATLIARVAELSTDDSTLGHRRRLVAMEEMERVKKWLAAHRHHSIPGREPVNGTEP